MNAIAEPEPDMTQSSKMPRRSRRSRRLLIAGALLAAMITGMLGIAAPANASATGCARWGSVHIPVVGVSIPTGQYCFSINGSGTTVNNTSGSYNTSWIVSPSEVVRFYDGRGNVYATFWGPAAWGNQYGYHYWATNISGTAQRGKVCGTLLSSGTEIVTVCEGIF